MAEAALSARVSAWNTQHANYLSLTQKLEQAPPQDRDALEREIAATEEDILATPAPHLIGVRQKLEMLLGEQFGLDPEAEARRLVIEDLDSVIQAQRDLLGA